MNLKTEIGNAFNRSAVGYEQAAIVQREIGNRLFERLELLTMQPLYVLDMGCGSGLFTERLKDRYPHAHVVGLDWAMLMLKQAKTRVSISTNGSWLLADMAQMPFPSGLFDLVFSNQVIHWAKAVPSVMRELNRVMKPGGCLMFSTLGPDTFLELRQAWASVDQYAHVNAFMDMHDLGDVLMSEHFLDPVVDMERLAVHYESVSTLVRGLKTQGVRNINAARNPGLTGRHAWMAFEQALLQARTEQGRIPLTYEVVYGHAWKGMSRRTEQGSEAYISVSQLRRSSD